MRSKLKLTSSIVAVGLMATPAFAETPVESYIRQLTEAGYTNIEVKTTFLGRTKIEAVLNGMERELIISQSGRILKDETEEHDDDEFDDEDDDENDDDESDDDEEDDDEDDDESDESDESDDEG